MKILIAEDNAQIQRAMLRFFPGHDVTVVGNAEEAVKLFDEGYVPEAVISDNSMGDGMTGYIFLSDVVRRRFRECKILLVSGDIWVADHAAVAGIPFLAKPAMSRALNEALGLSVI